MPSKNDPVIVQIILRTRKKTDANTHHTIVAGGVLMMSEATQRG
jgi:hypothetical protein